MSPGLCPRWDHHRRVNSHQLEGGTACRRALHCVDCELSVQDIICPVGLLFVDELVKDHVERVVHVLNFSVHLQMVAAAHCECCA
jgi:hypothetical protein